jgi:hypothetical protein
LSSSRPWTSLGWLTGGGVPKRGCLTGGYAIQALDRNRTGRSGRDTGIGSRIKGVGGSGAGWSIDGVKFPRFQAVEFSRRIDGVFTHGEHFSLCFGF